MQQWNDPEPVIVPIRGGFLANTPKVSAYQFATTGRTVDEAMSRFRMELGCWRELRDRLAVADATAP